MSLKDIDVEKVWLIIFVLVTSMFVGWYGERAVEKFMAINNKVQSF